VRRAFAAEYFLLKLIEFTEKWLEIASPEFETPVRGSRREHILYTT